MESFQDTDILFGFFALIISAALLSLYTSLGNSKRSLFKEVSSSEKKLEKLCELIMGRLPDDWTFVETFTDDIFFHQSEEEKLAFYALYGEVVNLPFLQLILIEKIITALEKQGIIEKVSLMYSREALLKYPDIFRSLPEWKKNECEHTLLVTSSKHRGERLIQFRKIPNGQESSYKVMKDIGMEATAPFRNLQ